MFGEGGEEEGGVRGEIYLHSPESLLTVLLLTFSPLSVLARGPCFFVVDLQIAAVLDGWGVDRGKVK